MSVQESYKLYQEGVNSPTVAGREENFNKALQLMQDLGYDTAEASYDIGNSYYQLEQYPWALFYYLKSQKMMPRDRDVRHNISATLQKLELSEESYAPWIPLSVSEEIFIAQALILVTTLLLSWKIWMKNQSLQWLINVFLGLTACCLLFIGIQYYLSPIHGVLAKAAFLYKHPDVQNERVFLDPLPPGTILQIIGVSEQGGWVKIVNESGVVGYVQGDKVLL